jgi:SAM-dependent methyltransferase
VSAIRIRDRLPFYHNLRHFYHWLKHRDARSELRDAKSRLLKSSDTSVEDIERLQAVSMKLHHADSMFVKGSAFSYLGVGLSAARVIQRALEQRPQPSEIRSILDLPCGYGRVMRFLRVMFPNADITAAEIDKEGVAFCQGSFAARPFFSTADFGSLSIDRKFDLIWCGSLITHITEHDCLQLLRFFHDHLTEQGVCIFTTHGTLSADWVKSKRTTYALPEEALESLIEEYESIGYGYVDYPGYPGYGISITAPERIRELARDAGNWQEILFEEHGWDNHQDVFAIAASRGESRSP